MRLYDPARRRIGTNPALLHRSDWIVPRLTIWPEETDNRSVRISAMVPADSEDASYVAREVSAIILTTELREAVAYYRADPEQFLSSFFNITLEAKHKAKPKPNQTATTPSYDDVGV